MTYADFKHEVLMGRYHTPAMRVYGPTWRQEMMEELVIRERIRIEDENKRKNTHAA